MAKTNDYAVLTKYGLDELATLLKDPNYKDQQEAVKAAIERVSKAAALEERQAKIFETLSKVDVSKNVEILEQGNKKLKYLSWASALKILKQYYPFATWRALEFEGVDGVVRQYRIDPETGNYTVYTEVTIEGITIGENLPVMDQNYAVRKEGYKVKTKYREYWIRPIDAMLVNKTIRRCLVKNLASFGLGIDLYIGDDLPYADDDEQTQKAEPTAPKPEPVQEPTAEPAMPELTLQQALDHILESGSAKVKGTRVGDIVEKSTNKKKSLNLLTLFAEKGVGSDKAACAVIKNALESGEIAFPETAV